MDSVSVALSLPIHPIGHHQGASRVCTMTVEEGTVLNIDGTNAKIHKYKNSVRTVDVEIGPGHLRDRADRVSVLSGTSTRSKTASQLDAASSKLPWYREVTCKDVRDIMPTVLILIGGLLIMIFVIPYAFSSVIKQLEAEQIMEKAREEAARIAKESATQETIGDVVTDFTTLPPSS